MINLTDKEQSIKPRTSPRLSKPINHLVATDAQAGETAIDFGLQKSFDPRYVGQEFVVMYIRPSHVENPESGKFDNKGTYSFEEDIKVVKSRVLKHLDTTVSVKEEKNLGNVSIFYFRSGVETLVKSALDGLEEAYTN